MNTLGVTARRDLRPVRDEMDCSSLELSSATTWAETGGEDMDNMPTDRPESPQQSFAKEMVWLTAELETRYPNADPVHVADLVSSAAYSFADARIRDFVPVLVRRQVEQELWSLGLRRAS